MQKNNYPYIDKILNVFRKLPGLVSSCLKLFQYICSITKSCNHFKIHCLKNIHYIHTKRTISAMITMYFENTAPFEVFTGDYNKLYYCITQIILKSIASRVYIINKIIVSVHQCIRHREKVLTLIYFLNTYGDLLFGSKFRIFR